MRDRLITGMALVIIYHTKLLLYILPNASYMEPIKAISEDPVRCEVSILSEWLAFMVSRTRTCRYITYRTLYSEDIFYESIRDLRGFSLKYSTHCFYTLHLYSATGMLISYKPCSSLFSMFSLQRLPFRFLDSF